MIVKVKDLEAGDTLPGSWTAVEDARFIGRSVQLDVRYLGDGGRGTRVWDDPGHELEIEREATARLS